MAKVDDRRLNDHTFKILIVGSISVGKTCLMHRFCTGIYHENYISTIGIDCMTRVIELGEQKVKLQIWDTAGQERYRTLTQAYYRGANGIILVYDVTNEKTFRDLVAWLSNIDQMASPHCCKVIVGNKADGANGVRQVMPERGQQFADSMDLDFFEVSCKNCKNVEDVFISLAKDIKLVQNAFQRRYSETYSLKDERFDYGEETSRCGCSV